MTYKKSTTKKLIPKEESRGNDSGRIKNKPNEFWKKVFQENRENYLQSLESLVIDLGYDDFGIRNPFSCRMLTKMTAVFISGQRKQELHTQAEKSVGGVSPLSHTQD